MLFSILIANYNNGVFFNDCYQSILRQTYQDFEVIIVDDCSTDDSLEIISALIKDDPRFRLFSNEKNRGCGFTKARCASLASGVVCGFVDPDDALTENALATMIASFGKHQDASMVSSKYYLTDLNLNITKAGSHGEQIPLTESYLTYGKAAITAFAAFRKSSYDQTPGISPEFKRAVDQDLYYKLEEVATPYYVDEFLYLYRINDNSISANANVFKAMYWHFRAKKEAYQRRKKNKTKAKNIEDNDFKEYANLYYINRLKRAGRLKKLGSKYYFLWKSIQTSPRLDWKYKVLCFVRPNFF